MFISTKYGGASSGTIGIRIFGLYIQPARCPTSCDPGNTLREIQRNGDEEKEVIVPEEPMIGIAGIVNCQRMAGAAFKAALSPFRKIGPNARRKKFWSLRSVSYL